MFIRCYLILFLCLIQNVSISQIEIGKDSLIKIDYNELRGYIKKEKSFSLKTLYAQAYLNKARKEKDSMNMAFGYYYKSIIYKDDNIKLGIYDSLIRISKGFKNKIFPTLGYYDKGAYYYNKQNYSKALENYILASHYNLGANKDHMEFLINMSISHLKLRIEENEEGLLTLKECWKYVVDKDLKSNKAKRYFNTLFNLANAYRKLNHIDSSRVYTRLGIIDSKSIGDDYYENLFKFLNAVLIIDSDLDNSIIELENSLKYMLNKKSTINVALAYQYLGKAYLNSGRYDNAINNFKKVDSIVEKEKLLIPELLISTNYIRNHYLKINNPTLELKYINKILKFDSIFNLNYRYLNKKIKNDYEIPILLKNKQSIISKLRTDNEKNNYLIYSLFLLIISILIMLFVQIYLRKTYSKRFKALIESEEKNHIKTNNEVNTFSDNNIINVPQELIEKILEEIVSFEMNNKFLDSSINANALAKSIGTNNSYFSKVFKNYKKTSFSSYLKNLRLEYGFEKIKRDPVFRKYTIRAIAKECGFNNPESFSKGFYKKYGIYPSYFIKNLDKVKYIDN